MVLDYVHAPHANWAGTTVAAFTPVMSGTPSGVGAFMSPKRFLNNGDVVEVEIGVIGVLRNKIVFQ